MKNLIIASLAALFVISAVAIALANETLPDIVQCSDRPVKCGDVLGPGGGYKLDEDLLCTVTPALTVLDGAHLNLNDHSLVCDPGLSATVGILLKGERTSVENGNIFDCDRGVVLEGAGEHSVSKIEYANSNPGTCVAFDVRSDRNRLFRNSAAACDGCFEVSGDRNWLIRNFVYDGPGVGFWFFQTANNNHIFHNIAVNQYAQGFLIQGDENNLLMNKAVGTLWENGAGFEIAGSGNRLWRNRATNNDGYGFDVFSTGTNNRLLENIAEDNQNTGITVPGTNNVIIRNKAFGNGDGFDSFDLSDGNLDCDNNTWRRNRFDTSNAECLK
jgi:parallel beta-helix repeat protein